MFCLVYCARYLNWLLLGVLLIKSNINDSLWAYYYIKTFLKSFRKIAIFYNGKNAFLKIHQGMALSSWCNIFFFELVRYPSRWVQSFSTCLASWLGFRCPEQPAHLYRAVLLRPHDQLMSLLASFKRSNFNLAIISVLVFHLLITQGKFQNFVFAIKGKNQGAIVPNCLAAIIKE